MNKKKWLLLILCVILIFGYIKLFYKTYNENVIPQSADYIIAIDVKRITNTILWNIITTPSQWKLGGIFLGGGGKHEVSWRDMVKIPDYIFIFHCKNQPMNAWYTVLEIKNEKDFTEGLQHYHFEALHNNEYISEESGLHIFRNADRVLVANAMVEDKKYPAQVANELFEQRAYVDKQTLAKTIDAQSHIATYIASNGFLNQEAIMTANFDKQKIEINSTLIPNKQYVFTENNFSYIDNALCSIGFTQPSPAVYNMLDTNSKSSISKGLSMNIDSLLLPNNQWYSIDIAGMKSRNDSAITYTYDSNFNKTEKVVVNNVQEPAFHFTIAGDSITNIYNYWQHSNKLEQTNAGQLFVPMPFTKSYCSYKQNELNITSANYSSVTTDKNIKCIFFIHISFSAIPKLLLNYFPDDITKAISNIESLQVVAKKNQGQIDLNIDINKKKNDLPILAF